MIRKNKEVFILSHDYAYIRPIVRYGVLLAKKLNMPANLLAVEPLPYQLVSTAASGIHTPHPLSMEKAARKAQFIPQLQKICLEMKSIWEHTHYSFDIGFREDKVVSLTEKETPSLLLLEKQNDLSTLNEWIGTFETRLAENSDCPVLVVPSELTWAPVNKILYIMDSADSKVDNMRMLSKLADNLEADLQVLMISEKAKNESDLSFGKMAEIFRAILDYKEITFHKVAGRKKADKVMNLVQETRPDWLAFEQKNTSLFERLFNSYNTKRLILQSATPVLVF